MKLRGIRECQSCETVWSYYETGSIECPNCGSLRSVGTEARRKHHTDSPVDLDLEPILLAVADDSVETIVDELGPPLREYTRRRGFISGGKLRPLDSTYLGAWELRYAVDRIEERTTPGPGEALDEFERLYVLELLRAVNEGDRLPADQVPDSMHDVRGAAYTDAVSIYREELTTWLDEHPDAEARRTLGTLRDYIARANALDGAVPIETAETLRTVTTEIYEYLTAGDESALASARDRLSRLSSDRV